MVRIVFYVDRVCVPVFVCHLELHIFLPSSIRGHILPTILKTVPNLESKFSQTFTNLDQNGIHQHF